MAIFPASANADARRLVVTRALRGFADGLVSVLLPGYLIALGMSDFQVGAIAAGTMIGSAALTLGVGLFGGRLDARRVLLWSCALMAATGAGFAGLREFWPLFAVAVIGTLNPSAGDVSVFLPTEQSLLAAASNGSDRTSLFALYNVAGGLAGALGALCSGLPEWLARHSILTSLDSLRAAFVCYGAIALLAWVIYRRLPHATMRAAAPGAALRESRGIVLKLSALFSLDSFGGGFVVQSLLALWLYRRFQLDVAAAGAIFFASGALAGASQLASPRVARRIGLVRAMVFTHLPANLFLIGAALVPSLPLAVALLLLRAALSSMDVPARQAYVMSVVPPEERAAASSVTNVPRSLASALPPLLTGAMLQHTSFGWPLICAGALKATYDLLLLWLFAHVPPRKES